jgi:hypothetical protein
VLEVSEVTVCRKLDKFLFRKFYEPESTVCMQKLQFYTSYMTRKNYIQILLKYLVVWQIHHEI